MPKPHLAALIVAVTLTIWPSAAIAAPSKRNCSPAGGHLLAANRYARVYWVARRDEYGTTYRLVYTCRHATKRRRFIGNYGPDPTGLGEDGIVRLQLAGRYVAFATQFSCDRYTGDCGGEIIVRDLVTGDDITEFVLDSLNAPPEHPGGHIALYGMQLKANGSVALIAGPANDSPIQVWKLDRAGEVLLDSGAGIDPHSLAIAANWIYWMRDGQPRSAPFR